MNEAVLPQPSHATVRVLSDPSPDWDPFVARHPAASVYLHAGWTLLARDVFRHQVYFFEARDAAGALTGVLPLVRQRGLLGDFATSIPFFNYGGTLADRDITAVALMERARELARELGCRYLELRDVDPKDGGWRVRTDKVSMVLSLPATVELLSKQLGSKLRSQVKRAGQENVTVRTGGIELLDGFYDVFARNMRDLGTPVYPKRFFRAIIERFAASTLLVVIEHKGVPGAGGFLVLDRGRGEIPWAACRSEMKPLGLNMRLYWEVLATVIGRGCTSFDFGRSTRDSGTYKFKKQWGAQPVQLHWHRWEAGQPTTAVESETDEEGRLRRYATAIWQRLPITVANTLGPLVSPSLPW